MYCRGSDEPYRRVRFRVCALLRFGVKDLKDAPMKDSKDLRTRLSGWSVDCLAKPKDSRSGKMFKEPLTHKAQDALKQPQPIRLQTNYLLHV